MVDYWRQLCKEVPVGFDLPQTHFEAEHLKALPDISYLLYVAP